MDYLSSLETVPHKYNNQIVEVLKNIDEIQSGVSQDEDFLYFRSEQKIKIYDRVCDHNGGRLSIRNTAAVCPLHGWILDLSTGFYTNARCSKRPILEINEYELDSPLISLPKVKRQLCGEQWASSNRTDFRFINHACFIIKMGDISFATDPWIIGSAFCNGWWLSDPSPVDAFTELNNCDFIYISHNHPDHLHPESLQKIRKDMPILTADFSTGSTVDYLRYLGFDNVIAMNFFSSLVDIEREILLSVLKSGDFRDDSGLFLQHGQFKVLLTVDSNFLNGGKFPTVDLLCSSFAGGASGFPLCFENYSDEERDIVLNRNRAAIKATNQQNIKLTDAKFFAPYAGFFYEAADRDNWIRIRNQKNKIEDFRPICEANQCQLLNIENEQYFCFEGSKLVAHEVDESPKMIPSYNEATLEYDGKTVASVLSRKIIQYFEGCSFRDDLLVVLIPTNDDFSTAKKFYSLDFRNNKYSEFDYENGIEAFESQALAEGLRYLRIKVRESELMDVICNGKPWEDLSIGFQCRIYRNPNVYNSEFWFYFTNCYVGNVVCNGDL